jgi:hypothetical protein
MAVNRSALTVSILGHKHRLHILNIYAKVHTDKQTTRLTYESIVYKHKCMYSLLPTTLRCTIHLEFWETNKALCLFILREEKT